MPQTALKTTGKFEKSVSHLLNKGATQGTTSSRECRTSDNSFIHKGLENNLKTDIWISVLKGATLLSTTARTIQRQIRCDKFVTRVVNGNGGKQYEILLSSMPLSAQMKYYEDANNTAEIRENKVLRIDTLGQDKEALAKYDTVKLYLKNTEKSKEKVTAKKTFEGLFNLGHYAELFSIIGTVSWKSIERWKTILEENDWDYKALVPQYSGKSISITEDESEVIIPLILSPNKLPASEIIRYANIQLQERGIELKSDVTYRRFIEKWISKNHDLYQLGRFGEKGLNDYALPNIRRDFDRLEVGDIVIADGHTFDFTMVNPINGKAKRLTIVLFYDMKSSVPLGFEIWPGENTRTIASALRRTILLLGFTPRCVYLDNGRAFRAEYFRGVKDFRQCGFEGLFNRLGIETMYAQAYHGQSKTIERFFGAMGEFERTLPTYCGNSVENKPARLSRNEKLHKRLYEGVVYNIDTVVNALLGWFRTYCSRPHQEGNYKGYTPEEIFNNSIEKVRAQHDFQNRIISKKELSYLMMESSQRCIGQDGIKIFNQFYWNEMLYGQRGRVQVKYDIFDRNELLVFNEEGEFMCPAGILPKTHASARLLGNKEDVDELKRQLEMKTRLRKETVQALEDIHGMQTEVMDSSMQFTEIKPEKTKKIQEHHGLKLVADEVEVIEEEPIFAFQTDREEYYRKLRLTN